MKRCVYNATLVLNALTRSEVITVERQYYCHWTMPSSLETKHYRRDLNYDSMIKGQIRERRKIEDLKNVSKKNKSLPIVFFGRYLFRVLFKFNFNGIFERYLQLGEWPAKSRSLQLGSSERKSLAWEIPVGNTKWRQGRLDRVAPWTNGTIN